MAQDPRLTPEQQFTMKQGCPANCGCRPHHLDLASDPDSIYAYRDAAVQHIRAENPAPEVKAERKHSHYFRPCPYDAIDPYRILAIFEQHDPCMQHIMKKALCGGNRGHKSFRRDLQDIIDTATRRLEMLDEDEGK